MPDWTDFVQGLVGTTGLQGQIMQQAESHALEQALGSQKLQQNAQAFPQEMTLAGLKIDKARDEVTRAGNYDRDVAMYLQRPTPQGLSDLTARYPERWQALKASDETRTVAARTSQAGIYGEIYSALDKGRKDLAIAKIRSVAEAERNQAAAGSGSAPDHLPELEGWIAALESDDESAANYIKGTALLGLARSTGMERFASTYGVVEKGNDYTLGPGQQRRDGDTNDIVGSAPFATRPVTVRPGVNVYSYDPNADGASASMSIGDLESGVLGAVPGARVTSRQRTRAEQVRLYAQWVKEGRPKDKPVAPPGSSEHESDRARDFAPPDGMSLTEFAARTRRALGPGARILPERGRNILHVELPRGQAGPMRKIASGGPAPQARQLTAEEVKRRKLDPARQWQISASGTISQIGRGGSSSGAGAGPRSPANVYAPILAKIARGEPLTAAEAEALRYYRRDRRAAGTGGGAGGAPAVTEGTVIQNAQGVKMIRRGGKWVPFK